MQPTWCRGAALSSSSLRTLTCAYRGARVRGSRSSALPFSDVTPSEPVPIAPTVSRPSGFLAAEAPSIARIRNEMDALRREKQERAFARSLLEKSAANTKAAHQDVNRSFTSAFAADQDASAKAALEAHAFMKQRRLQCDAHEVLRKKRAADSHKLAQMLEGPRMTPEARIKCEEDFKVKVLAKAKSLDSQTTMGDDRSTSVTDDALNDELALLLVLEDQSDETIRQWLSLGLVDPLWWVDAHTPVSVHSAGDSSLSDDVRPIDAHATMRAAGEFVENAVGCLRHGDVPEPDVALVIHKAEAGDFASITESELKKLEAFEKTNKGLTNRALSSSSPLLAAVAAHDPQLRTSLAVLERAKRNALLDKEFQDALDYLNTLEQARLASIERIAAKRRRASTEIPYFFGTNRSQPPPSADMNLPQPKLSAKARGILRRQKKLQRLRERFSK